jgi:hypothetical protein
VFSFPLAICSFESPCAISQAFLIVSLAAPLLL